MTKKNRLFEVKLLLKAKWPALHGEMADRGHSNFSECDEECLNCLRISIMTYGTSKFCAIIQNFMLTKLETGTFVNMLVCLAKVLVNRIKKRERRTIESISLSPSKLQGLEAVCKKGQQWVKAEQAFEAAEPSFSIPAELLIQHRHRPAVALLGLSIFFCNMKLSGFHTLQRGI